MSANFVIDETLANADSLEYISKSRIKEWVVCEWRFYKKYIEGKKEPENEAMRRGSDIHETFELFYENALDYIESHQELPDDLWVLLPDESLWSEYKSPYIDNFMRRESGRKRYLEDKAADGKIASDKVAYYWSPVAIEAEGWIDEKAPPWMGYADVILHAESLPTVTTDDGVVVLDFKTGETPNEEYRDKGIFLEGEFYALLFEDAYSIAAVAGYYPKDDDLLISPLQASRQEIIQEAVNEMVAADNPEDYEYEEQPLCAWGDEEGERCPYYAECESTWAVPIDNKETFVEYCEQEFSSAHIALELGTTPDAVQYWARKLGHTQSVMDM